MFTASAAATEYDANHAGYPTKALGKFPQLPVPDHRTTVGQPLRRGSG
jgi:hypothetical protein